MSRPAKVVFHPSWRAAADRAIEHPDEAAWWSRLDKVDRRYLVAKAGKARTLADLPFDELIPQDQRAIVAEAHHAAIVMADRTALI